ncbi:YcxB family protein [Micromonosporaceae bacterium Da 78-11]
MHLLITTKSDTRLVAAAVRRFLRQPLLIARCAGWAAIGIALLRSAITDDGLDTGLVGLGLVLALVIPIVAVNVSARRVLRDSHLTTYEISDTGIASSTIDTRRAYAWHAFGYVEQMSGQLLFGLDRTRMLPVPTSTLSPDQIDQVLGTAAGNGLQVRRL